MTETEWINHTYANFGHTVSQYRGAKFFVAQVLCLTRVTGARYAFVTVRDGVNQGYSLAFADGDNTRTPFRYELTNTPCNAVLDGNRVSLPCDVEKQFPAAAKIYAGYCGIPLHDESGSVLGLLALADDHNLPRLERLEGLLKLLAGRTAAELECLLQHQAIPPIYQPPQ